MIKGSEMKMNKRDENDQKETKQCSAKQEARHENWSEMCANSPHPRMTPPSPGSAVASFSRKQ